MDANASPPSSTAMQSNDEAHETPARPRGLNPPCWTGVTFQAPRPPVGLVDVITLKLASTVTHNDADAHDTRFRPKHPLPGEQSVDEPSTSAVRHADVPPVGFVDVSTFPRASTATHSDLDGHDTPVRP